MSITAGDVMDKVASLMNDSSKTRYTYINMLPYIQMAYQELAEEAENNDIPIINETDALVVTTAMTDIGGSTGPALPSDLVEIRGLAERLNGSTEDYTDMTRVDYLPNIQTAQASLVWWTWQNQIINFLGATTDRQVLLRYLGNTLGSITDNTTTIKMINAISFLQYRTAALCAMYIGEDKDRATALEGDAQNSLDRLINPSVKGRQSIRTRRRPFMAGLKNRGW